MNDVRASGLALIAGGTVLAASGSHSPLTCPLRALTGIPCPLCGMTTSVEETFHGHLGAALAANPAGVLAVALAFAVQLVRTPTIKVPGLVQISVGAGMWVFELHRFGVV
ncbi:MAG: DUF2752 domain-containing protein [Thermoleophilia bacterium]|nr:DUF2752 domain-containing protein [Thermoleophilia bacterium]